MLLATKELTSLSRQRSGIESCQVRMIKARGRGRDERVIRIDASFIPATYRAKKNAYLIQDRTALSLAEFKVECLRVVKLILEESKFICSTIQGRSPRISFP